MKLSLSTLSLLCALSFTGTAGSGCALDDTAPDEISAEDDTGEEALSETTQEISNGWHTVCWPAVRFYKRDDAFGTDSKTFHAGHRWYQVHQSWMTPPIITGGGTYYWFSYGHDNHGNIGHIRVASMSC